MCPDYRVLMCVNAYDDSGEFSGPPRNVPEEQIRKLFAGEGADEVELLESKESPEKAKRFKLDNIAENVYLISNK